MNKLAAVAALMGAFGMAEKFEMGKNKGTPKRKFRASGTVIDPVKKKLLAKNKRKNARAARRLNRK